MAARQLPLFEDERPSASVTQLTGSPAASTIRHHRLGEEVAYLVTARCTAVTFKLIDGALVRGQVLQVVEGQVVDTEWAVGKIIDLTAAEEAEAEQAVRERNEAAGHTVIELEEGDE